MSSALNRNKLYFFLLIACIAGYTWVIYNYHSGSDGYKEGINTCIIKQVTTIPCPSCGTTRSIISLVNGNFLESLYWNPLGIILVMIMVISPIWILIDFIFKKKSLYTTYRKTEKVIQNKYIAIVLIILILANWVWNIQKGL